MVQVKQSWICYICTLYSPCRSNYCIILWFLCLIVMKEYELGSYGAGWLRHVRCALFRITTCWCQNTWNISITNTTTQMHDNMSPWFFITNSWLNIGGPSPFAPGFLSFVICSAFVFLNNAMHSETHRKESDHSDECVVKIIALQNQFVYKGPNGV